MPPEVLGSLVSAGGSLLDSLGSQAFNVSNMGRQSQMAKDLMLYQWKNFSSPQAQIASLNKAGLGVNAYVGGKGSSATPSPVMPSSAPVNLDGVSDLGNISNYILSVAQAKKAGMDTKLSEQDIKNKEVERQRNEFELQLRREFGKDVQTADLANAYMKLVLASDQADLNEQDKALNEWKIASEKAISQANEHQRDILKQNLDNNPTKIKLENRLTELRGSESAAAAEAHRASAEASRSQADLNRENRRLQSALADIEESSKVDKIDALIRQYNAEGALSDADYKVAALKLKYLKWRIENREDEQRFEDIDNLGEWLKDKVSIFKLAK